jgi:hypothetical protein
MMAFAKWKPFCCLFMFHNRGLVWIQGCVKSYDVFEKLDYYKIGGS